MATKITLSGAVKVLETYGVEHSLTKVDGVDCLKYTLCPEDRYSMNTCWMSSNKHEADILWTGCANGSGYHTSTLEDFTAGVERGLLNVMKWRAERNKLVK